MSITTVTEVELHSAAVERMLQVVWDGVTKPQTLPPNLIVVPEDTFKMVSKIAQESARLARIRSPQGLKSLFPWLKS